MRFYVPNTLTESLVLVGAELAPPADTHAAPGCSWLLLRCISLFSALSICYFIYSTFAGGNLTPSPPSPFPLSVYGPGLAGSFARCLGAGFDCCHPHLSCAV